MTRMFCDRCGGDITDEQSGHVTGVEDADAGGNGNVTDDFDLCSRCYVGLRTWMRTRPAVKTAAKELGRPA